MRQVLGLLFITAVMLAGTAMILLGYFLPTIVVLVRKGEHVGETVVVNLLLGWTFLGWVVALAAAVSGQGNAWGHASASAPPSNPAQPLELPVVIPLAHVSTASLGDVSQVTSVSDASSGGIGFGL
jgi:uncharacterized membrane protein YqaE (UPF0057 family)